MRNDDDHLHDEHGFWDDQPTTQLRRTRSHHRVDEPMDEFLDEPTRLLPVRAFAQRRPSGLLATVDHRLLRIGAAALALVVLVPTLFNGGGGASPTSLEATPASVTTTASNVLPNGDIVVPLDGAVVPAEPAAAALPATQAPAAEPVADPAPAPVVETGQADGAAAQPATPAVQPEAQSATAPTSQTKVEPAKTAAQLEAERVAGCAKKYTVVKGDYWILIARKHSVKLSEVLRANGATAKTAIYPGRTVCLPANASPATTAPATTVPATTKPATTTPPTTTKPATTVPQTTKPPATTVPPSSYTRDQVTQIIRNVWPDDLENEAIRIATRESNLKPNVRNYCCFGLFQIYFSVHKSWLDDIGITSAEQLYDPTVNAYAAFVLYNRAGGWDPWKL
jgi:LysM repeat protein